jgi:hypothetical protein
MTRAIKVCKFCYTLVYTVAFLQTESLTGEISLFYAYIHREHLHYMNGCCFQQLN